MLMRPNSYILNSDYLSFAQVSKTKTSVTFSAQSAGYNTTQDFIKTISVTSVVGGIDRCFVKINNSVLLSGQSFFYFPSNNTLRYERFLFNRLSPNTIEITEVIRNGDLGTWSAPAATLDITILTFRPPNTS